MSVTRLENPKYYLSLASPFRDEARFLKEWIEFHLIVGVQHFYLFNHLSKDNYKEVLKPYIDMGVVDLIETAHCEEPSNDSEWYRFQFSCYNRAVELSKLDSEWLIICDSDEFYFPTNEFYLSSALKQYDDRCGVIIEWLRYGSNNVDIIPDDKLMIECILKRGDHDNYVKTIVKPRYVGRFSCPHIPTMKSGYRLVPMGETKTLRCNHYWARDLKFFNENKVSRRHVRTKHFKGQSEDDGLQSLLKRDQLCNKILDTSIHKYIIPLRNRMNLSLPKS